VIIISKYLPKRVIGLTVFPFVFLKQTNMKLNAVLINHERIHLRQQLELLVIPFYLIYLIEFCTNFIKYKNVAKAYRNISFEKEAYQNEKDLEFLKSRSFWNFIKYYRI
jgi:hypothetical protein